MRTPPSRRMRRAISESGCRFSANGSEPYVVGWPAISMLSFSEIGTPQSSPRSPEPSHAASAACAACMASSVFTARNALSFGSSRSMRSNTSRVTSTGEKSRLR